MVTTRAAAKRRAKEAVEQAESVESSQPKTTPRIEPPEQESDEQNEELVGANFDEELLILLEVGKDHTCRDNEIEQIDKSMLSKSRNTHRRLMRKRHKSYRRKTTWLRWSLTQS